ncbi:ATP-binding protein [Virgibacillus halodenitrificans]|uniref:sensor histidine kinase n=1 Tax=Virgibacillus halodenitrificans TaxID=1482 RepID=UPI0024C01EB3|nr:sensor histidine kinase [Virgibacillus halodenitrificans]WHX26345.1 ATP-binding protein [Virgibacillus halodenitrificans]
MLIILMLFLILISILVLIVKRNKETFYIFGMCSSLAVLLIGIMLYIAKKGGISEKLQDFYFFNPVIKSYAQYFYITLDTLGYMVAIGRYIFPLFLLLLAMHYSEQAFIKRNKWVVKLAFLPPLFSLVLYHPDIFHIYTSPTGGYNELVSDFSLIWVLIYVILAFLLLIVEAVSIQIRIFQSRFMVIILFIFSITFLYLLYFGQNPIQIYQFYYWGNGIYYMDAVLSVPAYLTLVIINIALAVVGFAGLLKYTKEMFDTDKEEIKIQRNYKAASAGATVFVHSIKNQLLANRVIFKRMNAELDRSIDPATIKNYTDQLEERNNMMLERVEELYQSVKAQTVHLVPVTIAEVVSHSMDKFHNKYPENKVQLTLTDEAEILADAPLLSEAIYNLLTNAQEAVEHKNLNDSPGIFLRSYNTRQYTVIEIRDVGTGIKKTDTKKIMEPFYSTKNSNFNWGMGLHYVHTIVKEHLGILRFESKEGEGTTFFLFLPKFK